MSETPPIWVADVPPGPALLALHIEDLLGQVGTLHRDAPSGGPGGTGCPPSSPETDARPGPAAEVRLICAGRPFPGMGRARWGRAVSRPDPRPVPEVGAMPFFIFLVTLAAILLLVSVRRRAGIRAAGRVPAGRLVAPRGPGLILLVPLIERGVRVGLRTVTSSLETQETVTRDGVAVRVNAVLWHQILDPVRATVQVENWSSAVIRSAETTLRDIIGQNDLDGLLKARDQANAQLKQILTDTVAKWGIQIVAVEIKDLDIPETMQRAIAKEAEAIREQRARIIKAEGEFKAAEMLASAARIIAAEPGALELRRLQTLTEIGAEHNSTIVVSLQGEGTGVVGTSAAIARAVAAPPG